MSLPSVFKQLDVAPTSPDDEFELTYRNGLLTAKIKRSNGVVENITRSVSGPGLEQTSTFIPAEMSKEERNQHIKKMAKKGHSQSEIADIFGLRQPTISRIIKS